MAMEPHERVLQELARAHLAPAGLVQKGRSRLWYEDHGWWLGVVELKASGYSRGTALTLAAHWLWWAQDHISFDFSVSFAPCSFVEYESEDQFRSELDHLLRMALVDFGELRDTCDTIAGVARRLRVPSRDSWARANAGIASALAGDTAAAHQDLRGVSAEHASVDWHRDLCRRAAELDALVDDDAAFRRLIADQISVSRAALKLPPWTGTIV